MEEIKTGIYQHFKGGKSLVIGVAEHSDGNSLLVIYKGLQDKKLHARPYESFVEKVKNSEGKMVPRFTLIEEINLEELSIESKTTK